MLKKAEYYPIFYGKWLQFLIRALIKGPLVSSKSMSETLDMHRLKAEHMLRRARLAALGESFVILTLLVWLSLEFQNNFYMQQWLAAHFWPAQWLLNGTLVGVATGLLTGWILATWQGKRSREQKILDDLRKIV